MKKIDLARELMLEFPNITENRAIAKMLHNRYPLLFKNIEDARTIVRACIGKRGEFQRKNEKKKISAFLEKLNETRAKFDIDIRTQSDKTPYVFDDKHNKALVMSDWHYPYTSMSSLDLTLEYADKENVDCIILNGDILDFSTISRFISKPNEMRVMEQIEGVKNLLAWMQSVMNVKIVYHAGNHCFEKGTEVLTKDKGFIYFEDLTEEDLVAQFDENKKISFEKPISYISKNYEGKMYLIENSYTRQSVTDMHDVVIIKDGKIEKKKAKDFTLEDIRHIPLSGDLSLPDYDIKDDMLRLVVNFVMDGTLVLDSKYNPNSKKVRLQFKLSKERKISRLLQILEDLEMNHTLRECKKTGLNILQPYYIRIYGDAAKKVASLINYKKELPAWFRRLSKRQVEIVLKEIELTDGSTHDGGINWSTTNLNDANLIQEICHLNGFLSNVKKYDSRVSGFKNGKEQYSFRMNLHNPMPANRIISEKDYNGQVYCVEMPLGTVITRLNGKVSFSGNCKRIEDYTLRQAPELYHQNKLNKLLMLEDMKIDYVEDYRYMKFGNLNIAHGHHIVKGIFAPVNPARGAYTKTNTSTLISHVHRTSEHIETDMNGKVIGCYSIGCMTDITPDYNPQVSKHNQGFAIVTKDPITNDFEVNNKKIINNKIR